MWFGLIAFSAILFWVALGVEGGGKDRAFPTAIELAIFSISIVGGLAGILLLSLEVCFCFFAWRFRSRTHKKLSGEN